MREKPTLTRPMERRRNPRKLCSAPSIPTSVRLALLSRPLALTASQATTSPTSHMAMAMPLWARRRPWRRRLR